MVVKRPVDFGTRPHLSYTNMQTLKLSTEKNLELQMADKTGLNTLRLEE